VMFLPFPPLGPVTAGGRIEPGWGGERPIVQAESAQPL